MYLHARGASHLYCTGVQSLHPASTELKDQVDGVHVVTLQPTATDWHEWTILAVGQNSRGYRRSPHRAREYPHRFVWPRVLRYYCSMLPDDDVATDYEVPRLAVQSLSCWRC